MNLIANSSTTALNPAGDHPATVITEDDDPIVRDLLEFILDKLGKTSCQRPIARRRWRSLPAANLSAF